MVLLIFCLAFLSLARSFAVTNKLTDEEFAAFTAPNNHVAQILLAHFLILDHMVQKWACGSKCLPYLFKKDISLQWVDNVAVKLPAGYKKYMVWPMGTAVALQQVKMERLQIPNNVYDKHMSQTSMCHT